MKYGWRNNKLTAKEVVADDFTTDALTLDATTVGTAVTSGTVYFPIEMNGSTYYVQANK